MNTITIAEAAAKAGVARTDSVRRALRNAGIEMTYAPNGDLVVDRDRFERLLERRGGSLKSGRPVRTVGNPGDVYNGKCKMVRVDELIMTAKDPWHGPLPLDGIYPSDAYVHDVFRDIFFYNVLISSNDYPERQVGKEIPREETISPDLLEAARDICRQRGWIK